MTFLDGRINVLVLFLVMAFHYQLLFLSLDGRRWMLMIADCRTHPVEIKANTEQYKSEDQCQEQFVVLHSKALHTSGCFIESQRLSKGFTCFVRLFSLFLVGGIILIRHLLANDQFLPTHD